MTVSVSSDRRLFDRFEARFPVKFQDSRNEFGENVFLRDASAQGARFVTSEKVSLADRIGLLVQLPDGHSPLDLHGKVVWVSEADSDKTEIGLEFDNVRLMRLRRLYQSSVEE